MNTLLKNEPFMLFLIFIKNNLLTDVKEKVHKQNNISLFIIHNFYTKNKIKIAHISYHIPCIPNN
jgi:hypothetical protein